MKKINKIVLIFGIAVSSILGFFANSSQVMAENYSGQSIREGEFISNIYINKIRANGSNSYQQAQFIRRSEDNQFVYCLQPFVSVNSNSLYQVIRSDYEVVLNMSREQLSRINLYAYYGYGYGNHTDNKWYAITQVLIWRTADPSSQFFFTNTLNGSRNDSLFASEIAELENLVNTHYLKPEFNNASNIKLPITSTISLNDINGKLSEYKIAYQNNVSASISGNTLNITATGIGNASITLSKIDTKFSVPPIVYFSDSSQNAFRLGAYDPLELIFNLEVIGGKVAIQKVDSEILKNIPQGQATLEGAVYGVYKENGTKLTEITTDKNGYVKSNYLPCIGKLYIQEIKPSKGYQLDSTKYYVELKEGNLEPTVEVKEDVIKNYISILKQYDYVDGTTQFLNAEENINFEIFYPDGRKYETITTDKNGYASINIPYGVWKFHQVNSTTGYEKIHDFYVTVDENSNKEQYYNILNNALSAYLQIIKKDSETGKIIKLSDVTFKIINTDTKQYVSQYVGGKVISQFKTDENGVVITPLKLSSGNYKIVEISSPKGYILDESGVEFTIGENTHFNYTTYGAFVVIEYLNTAIKGQIEINKTGEVFKPKDGTFEYEEKPLSNVEFQIIANEDIKSSDGNYIYYNKGDVVETLVTDENGYAISTKLPLGKYILVETKTNENYILNEEKYNFELIEKDNRTPIVYSSYSVLNKYKKGILEFSKVDSISGQFIPNTEISIYTSDEQLVFTGMTDQKGKIIINDLAVGKYYIVENNPSIGYLLSKEKFYFEIKNNGEVVKVKMKNKPITSTLVFTKIDVSTSAPLPNTLIEIYNDKDELIFSGRTDFKGQIIIEKLRYGKYYILEKEAPEGYALNEERMYFEVKEDGEIIKCTMTDEIIVKEVPDTMSNRFPIEIISIVLVCVGLGVMKYGKNKK